MSANTITIKPNNHRVHPCPHAKKPELLNQLIAKNSSLDIVVVCSQNPTTIKEALDNKDIVVMDDREFIGSKELSCEMLISYDVPDKAIVYLARASKATQSATILVDESQQKELYKIEMLLGRAIKQEKISGFEYEVKKAPEVPKGATKKLSKDEIKEVAKKRYEEKTGEPKPKKPYNSDKKPYDKDSKKSNSNDKWAKKNKTPNKFLGKDENGKAIFSGKSGERNHRYDGTPRDKWDAPKKVGRKINIKELKKKEE